MNLPNRNYTHSDADMLTVCATLTETAIAHKAFLQTKRSNWADPYFGDLKQRIADIAEKHLGADNAKDLRNATLQIAGLQKRALSDLADFKVQLDVDYGSDKLRRTELLKQLGFTDHLKRAQKNDQEALAQLLYAFKTAMSPALQAEMVGKGAMPAIIDQITGYADGLQQANVLQEFNKGGRKNLTAERVSACNMIYDEVIGISKMASKFLKDKPALQSSFSYSRVLSALQGGTKTAASNKNVVAVVA